DIALFAMGYACMTKARFGEFGRSKKGMTGRPEDESKRDTSLGEIPIEDFRDLFVKNVRKINGLVFDSGTPCKAFCGEIREILPKLDVDLVYADPPYITEFGANDYEGKMHFVEGLMTMWAGKQIRDNARRDYESGTKYNKETIASLIGDVVEKSRAKSILMSYRDKAFPREPEVVEMLKKRFDQVAVKRMDVRYNIARYGPEGGGKDAQELLFVASGPLAAQANTHANFHTRITGQVITKSLIAQAQTDEGDKRFSFILTHAGTNKNGDHFTEEECRKAYQSVVGTKIDVAHSQDFRDIVGGVVSSEYVEDGEQSRIECVGEIYTGVTEAARQAYALVRKGIIRQVSMECDYAEGECSICGKKVKSKAEYCVHLKNYKGGAYQNKPCFEILHGVVFTGVGLLDKKGADENARIKKVASFHKEKLMADKSKQSKGQDEFLDQEDPGGEAPAEEPSTDGPDAELKKLRLENKKLKKQLEEAQTRISELETEQAAAARWAKAETVLKKWEGKGRSFENDEARTAELNRLAGLTEEAILATEQVIDSLTTPKKDDPAKPPLPGDLTKRAEAQVRPRMKADAGVDPLVVDDKKPANLEEKLRTGFMAAYKANVSQEVA
ncbi:MAG: DNA methyltransferase, partial [Deltaproteobacteria bacterium]|nr:DNA methyltransferase [Deltaproteobacteria bacterium]